MMAIDQELDAIGRSVAVALSRPHLRAPELRDVVSRLGRVEDAMAGLRVSQGMIVQRMITFVSFATGTRPSLLISQRRQRDLAHGRFAIMWGARELTPYSYPMIGRLMGGFDHTSVLHGVRRAEQLRESDPNFRRLTDAMIVHFTRKSDPNEEEQPCLL